MTPEAARRLTTAVIPAQAGIHPAFPSRSKWIPACAGMTSLLLLRRQFALWILLLFPLFANAQLLQPAQPGDDLQVALVTFGPGEEVWERFGHNAILIS